MQSGGAARAERVLVNMLEGKMFVEFRAETREALEAWLKTEGMHFDWMVRVEWETRGRMGSCIPRIEGALIDTGREVRDIAQALKIWLRERQIR